MTSSAKADDPVIPVRVRRATVSEHWMPAFARHDEELVLCPSPQVPSRPRGEIVGPRLGGLLRGGTILRLQLSDQIVEYDIAIAARLGDEVPSRRLHQIGWQPAPAEQDMRQPILRNRVSHSC